MKNLEGQASHRGARAAALGVTLFLCFVVGFTLGRLYGERRPIQFIGRPVEHSGNIEPPAGSRPPRPKALSTPCNAPTRKGTPCKRMVSGGGFCWQHREKAKR